MRIEIGAASTGGVLSMNAGGLRLPHTGNTNQLNSAQSSVGRAPQTGAWQLSKIRL